VFNGKDMRQDGSKGARFSYSTRFFVFDRRIIFGLTLKLTGGAVMITIGRALDSAQSSPILSSQTPWAGLV
jgi:hypothetical protein